MSEQQIDIDPGGVAFDDDFDVFAEAERVDRGGGGAKHDSAASLQSKGIQYPTSAPAGMRVLRAYVIQRWGGIDLGILARPPRAIRAGSSPSMHNWGMAWDWRWANPGPGRQAADEVIEWAIAESNNLGIQAVHDYVNARYWKSNAGWTTARSSPSTGFGQPWSQWLHIERTWDAANNPDAVDGSTTPADRATVEPAVETGRIGFAGELPPGPVRRGDNGADVARIQDFLRSAGFADFTVSDGEFGPRTEEAVRAAQVAFAAKGLYTLEIDGIWGPATAKAASRFGGS